MEEGSTILGYIRLPINYSITHLFDLKKATSAFLDYEQWFQNLSQLTFEYSYFCDLTKSFSAFIVTSHDLILSLCHLISLGLYAILSNGLAMFCLSKLSGVLRVVRSIFFRFS